MEKCQFFDFLNFLFLLIRKGFCRFRISYKTFPSLYCLGKKSRKNGHFWTKPLGLLEKCHFSTFWTSCFYRLERRFLALEYRTHIPSNMCSPTFETDIHHIFAPLPEKHLLLVICVPLPWKHIFLVKCVPLSGKHIRLVICVFLPGKQISLVIFSPTWETHIPCDMRFLTR